MLGAGLKIRRSERFMRVRFPPQAPRQSRVYSQFNVVIRGWILHMLVCIYARNYAHGLFRMVGSRRETIKLYLACVALCVVLIV